jgi:hypothetical protein
MITDVNFHTNVRIFECVANGLKMIDELTLLLRCRLRCYAYGNLYSELGNGNYVHPLFKWAIPI